MPPTPGLASCSSQACTSCAPGGCDALGSLSPAAPGAGTCAFGFGPERQVPDAGAFDESQARHPAALPIGAAQGAAVERGDLAFDDGERGGLVLPVDDGDVGAGADTEMADVPGPPVLAGVLGQPARWVGGHGRDRR